MAVSINRNKFVYTNYAITQIIIMFLCGIGIIIGAVIWNNHERSMFVLVIGGVLGLGHIIIALLTKMSVLVIDKKANSISRFEKTLTGLFTKQMDAKLDDVQYICYNIGTDTNKRGASRSSSKSLQFFAMIKDYGRFLICPPTTTPRSNYKKLGTKIADFAGVEFRLSIKVKTHDDFSGETKSTVKNEILEEENKCSLTK